MQVPFVVQCIVYSYRLLPQQLATPQKKFLFHIKFVLMGSYVDPTAITDVHYSV